MTASAVPIRVLDLICMLAYIAMFLSLVCDYGTGRAKRRDDHGDYLDAGGDSFDCGGSDCSGE